jgi:hypothetical protein
MKAAGRRLRGNNLDKGRRTLGELGLDLDVLAKQLDDMGPRQFFANSKYLSMEEGAVMRGAQKTQFFPGTTRTPLYWRHPIGRVALQFKTFAVGQTRFFRDAVLNEWSHGNRAPMATLLAFGPIAGEAVGDIKSLITDRDRPTDGVERYFENFTYIGGLGLFTDVLGQARWGNLESVFLGPTFGDLTEMGEALISDEGEGILRLGKRQPAFKSGAFLAGAANDLYETLDEYLDLPDDNDSSEGGPISVFDLRTERASRKR